MAILNSALNYTPISNQLGSDLADLVTGKISSLNEGKVLGGGGLSEFASTALSYAATLPMFNSNTTILGMPGNKAFLTQFPNIVVSVQRYGSKDIPTTVMGRPCYKNVKINTLTGFVKCAGASVPINGLASDRDRINAYLNSGFYYE